MANALVLGIDERCGHPPLVARDTAGGAALLALRSLTGRGPTDEVHRRIVGA